MSNTTSQPLPPSLAAVVESGLCIGCGLCESIPGRERMRMVMTPQGRERPLALQPIDAVTERLPDAAHASWDAGCRDAFDGRERTAGDQIAVGSECRHVHGIVGADLQLLPVGAVPAGEELLFGGVEHSAGQHVATRQCRKRRDRARRLRSRRVEA